MTSLRGFRPTLSPPVCVLVLAKASPMVRIPMGTGGHLGRVIPLLAVRALTPVRVPARIQGTLPLVEKVVIGAVLAYDQVLRAIIGSLPVYVVNNSAIRQQLAEGFFSNEYLTRHVPSRNRTRVAGRFFQQIPRTVCHTAIPSRVAFPERIVPRPEAHRLPFYHAFLGDRTGCDRRKHPATTLTDTGRINQGRAPKVCADRATNITLSGRLS